MPEQTDAFSTKDGLSRSPRELCFGLNRDQIRNRINVSFSLNIPGLGEIACQKILRGVSGKRLSCYGSQPEKEFVLKLFFDPHRAQKYWQRSYTGHLLFGKHALLTPEIRFSGYLNEYGLYAIIFDYVPNARPLDQALSETFDQANLLRRLARSLALCHQKGLIQHDTSPNNFLIQNDEKIFFLDGDHVHFSQKPVPKKKALNNLAHLMSTLHSPVHDFLCTTCFNEYARARHWPACPKTVLLFQRKVRSKQKRNRLKFLWKKGGWKKYFQTSKG